MKRYRGVAVVFCLISSSAWSMFVQNPGWLMKRLGGSNETSERQAKKRRKVSPKALGALLLMLSRAGRKAGSLQPFKDLLARGADANVADEKGSALHYACAYNDYALVELLLDNGAQVNAQSPKDYRPLHVAAQKGYKKVCELLVDRGARVDVQRLEGWTPLHDALQRGHTKVCEFLVGRGAPVNAADSRGITPLYVAAETGNKEICALLVVQGAQVNAQSSGSWKPLHVAAYNGHKEVCKLLIDGKADVNALAVQGGTPLHMAAYAGQEEVCELLIGCNADVNAPAAQRSTPLHVAAAAGHKEVCELLVVHGAQVNAKTDRGFVSNNDNFLGEYAALHVAVYFNKRDIVEFLIAAGADRYARMQDGKTALEMAYLCGHRELIHILENTLEEELPAALPQVAAVERMASHNLLSAVEQGDTQSVQHLLDAKDYTANELRAAYKKATGLNYHHMMGLMTAKGAISFESVPEKVPMS